MYIHLIDGILQAYEEVWIGEKKTEQSIQLQILCFFLNCAMSQDSKGRVT